MSVQQHPGSGHTSSQVDDVSHIAESVSSYKKLFFGLLLLTFLTVAVSYVDFGSHFWNFVVGLAIATVKAGLVAAIFMHLWGEKFTIWRFLIFTTIFVTGLFVLSLLAHHDPIPSTATTSHGKFWVTRQSWSSPNDNLTEQGIQQKH